MLTPNLTQSQVHGPWEGKGVVKAVRCGPWCSWVMVEDEEAPEEE